MKGNAIIYHICLNLFAALFIAFFLTLVNTVIYIGFTSDFSRTLGMGTLVGIAIGFPVACILSLIAGKVTANKYSKGTKEYSVIFNAVMALLMDFVMNFFIPLVNASTIPTPTAYLNSLLISYGIIFVVGLFTEKYCFMLTDFVTLKILRVDAN